MRERRINTTIEEDPWFTSLPIEEQRVFLQFLITRRGELSGVFQYSDRQLLFDMPFLNHDRLQLIKRRFEADDKVYFKDGWVWLKNFKKNNNFKSYQQQAGIATQINSIQRKDPQVMEYFETKGFNMSELDSYFHQKQRNKVKKELRRSKPYLMGQALDAEVDRVMGIAKSGKMDWAVAVEATRETSSYPTPESITKVEIKKVAKEHAVQGYVLYWVFYQKLEKLKAVGRGRTDYFALLVDCVPKAIRLNMDDAEKITAAKIYAKNIHGKELSVSQLQAKIIMGEL